ncbi:MAG: ATP-binding protein [Bosea sp.]|uniref:ATP-binding protein n=1 Tax=Bosea sp. (in: a-proteobacteria) TaxID=1871050 RepID=UPI00238E0E7C|nr:ATP-binding protein [Bosea sp. (in: a-proteobacteria)]MCP4740462.1 ATP-binding protein [Bosea sp. (in: a-proteobacteria)]
MQLPANHRQFESEITADRRDPNQPADRALGRVIACSGSRATIAASASGGTLDGCAIGRLLSINLGRSRIVGLVYEMRALDRAWNEAGPNSIAVEVELLGEVADGENGTARFDSGITTYPPIGALAHRIRSRDLEHIHDLGQRKGVALGCLTQDASVSASVDIERLLSRHFAVLGTTGVGKSSAVALILRKAVEAKPNLRILILDPHNEYAHAFPENCARIDASMLDLPFWLFRFEEFADIVFRGRPPLEDEAEILREVIAVARSRYRVVSPHDMARDLGSSVLKRPLDPGARKPGESSGSAELAAPYRLADLFAAIDELIGLHELRYPRTTLRALRVRLETLHGDPRYGFLFAHANSMETIAPVISQVFRVPHRGRPITVFQLAGLPSEVVNAVASSLARLAFDLAMASRGSYEILLLCEEAHRYVPQDQALGFAPTRQAIARIAKEGRKYGAYLGIVTQRPGELDPTILSQCSTVFAMRLGNDRDQEIIRAAIADASASTIAFLSSIGNREAIAFGEAVATTMRMRFLEQRPEELPAMAGRTPAQAEQREPLVEELVARMRGL